MLIVLQVADTWAMVAAQEDFLILGLLAEALADILAADRITENIHTLEAVVLVGHSIHQHTELVPAEVLVCTVKDQAAKVSIRRGVEITRRAVVAMAAQVEILDIGVKTHGAE
jgi:hypothetical protein